MRAQGYACITEPDCGIRETDTYTCEHCNRIIHLPVTKKLEDVGDFCRGCMKVICASCADLRVCTPFLKKLDRLEARYHARRSYGL